MHDCKGFGEMRIKIIFYLYILLNYLFYMLCNNQHAFKLIIFVLFSFFFSNFYTFLLSHINDFIELKIESRKKEFLYFHAQNYLKQNKK